MRVRWMDGTKCSTSNGVPLGGRRKGQDLGNAVGGREVVRSGGGIYQVEREGSGE